MGRFAEACLFPPSRGWLSRIANLAVIILSNQGTAPFGKCGDGEQRIYA
jgi:hypothetical protein